jgi:protein-disulfide isomerase
MVAAITNVQARRPGEPNPYVSSGEIAVFLQQRLQDTGQRLAEAKSRAGGQSGSKTLAIVNGAIVTEDQVLKNAASDLQKLESNRPASESAYAREKLAAMWKALDALIDEKLIAAEAEKLKMTAEQLVWAEIDSNVETPSDGEVEAFYDANKDRIPIPRAEALPQVRQYLIDQSKRRFREGLIRRLKRSNSVTTYLDPLRTEVATAGRPSRGAADAPVTIVEFADFECPFCGGVFPILQRIEKNYEGKVRFVYRHFPLTSIHPHAQKAAEASICAAEQGRFWEFHDSLFSNQRALTVDDLKRRAQEFKLNTADFNACLDSGRQAGAVKQDAAEGTQAGVTGTPTIFINGRRLSGSQSYADLQAVIDDELRRTSAGK